ncbi:FAD/NAD(P)-binding domain-containing protein [Ganoderma leucocontextum]|nr:FAD/NAD(P)-binding domain-containing protein [Ganoderma leucocontextum]
MTTNTAQPRIAIIGGGPGGLTLLLTLHKRGIPATLYEREVGFASRRHLGGTLDLGHESGQRALRENGLQEQWEANSRPEGDSYRFWDSQKLVVAFDGLGASKDPRDLRPEIDRSMLRKIMLDAVPADAVKWDHTLTSVRPLGGGEHELTFANGHTTVSDVLVGADGAYSRVRPLLSKATPIYHGITGAEISLAPETTKLPELKETIENVGPGSMFALDHERLLGAQVNGDGRIRTYTLFRAPEDWKLPEDPAEGRKALLAMLEGWAPWMRKLIEHCDPVAMYQRPLYHLPVDHSWEHTPGVTLLGDAAHLMSPVEEREASIAAWEEVRMSEGRRVGVSAAHRVELAFTGPGPEPMLKGMRESRALGSELRRKA